MSKKDANVSVPEMEDEAGGEPVEVADTEAVAETAREETAAMAPEATDGASALARELEQARDQLLRQVAEFQNYRRRMEKERATLVARGRMEVIEPLLNVLDDFRRSIEAAVQAERQEEPDQAYRSLKQGVELVYRNFSDALAKLGVESIEAIGKPFDEHEHEALMQLPAPEGTEPGVVLEELQRGYRLGDRVLRHSKVIVAA